MRLNQGELDQLLPRALRSLERKPEARTTEFESAFFDELVAQGCDLATAELLVDYLPAACGHAFLREIDALPPTTYSRRHSDGSWGPPQKFSDDPLWHEVERFVETIRTNPETRQQFGWLAQHSAEVNAVNNALKAGETMEKLKGAVFATVFSSPLRHAQDAASGNRTVGAKTFLSRLRALLGV